FGFAGIDPLGRFRSRKGALMRSPDPNPSEPRKRGSLFDLLSDCTVQICVNGELCGTGFFIAQGLVLTAAHVIAGAADPKNIQVTWRGNASIARRYWREPSSSYQSDPYPYPDMAVIDLNTDNDVWVEISDDEPILIPRPDALFAMGWSKEFAS